MKFRMLAAVAMATMLSGCVTFSGLDPKSNYAEVGNGSIIVMGVSPAYRVHIFEGERVGDKWKRDIIATKLNVYPVDGYIVARVPARTGAENYGIGGILPDGIGGKLFIPCIGRKSLTFDAPAGKVVYIGDVTLAATGRGIGYNATSDIEAARAHLKARFPLLADKLVAGAGFENPELVNVPCTSPAIPIVIVRP